METWKIKLSRRKVLKYETQYGFYESIGDLGHIPDKTKNGTSKPFHKGHILLRVCIKNIDIHQ